MNIRDAARRFTAHMERHGVTVERYDSNLSESVYLTCHFGEEQVYVRGSNHEAKPTYQAMYGAADVEFGRHPFAIQTVTEAIVDVLRRLEIEPDAKLMSVVRRLESREASRQRAEREKEAKAAARRAERQVAADRLEAECIKRYPSYERYRADYTKSHKDKCRVIRRKVEAELKAEGAPL